MPVNRNALIRYKTLDQCLQNRFRKWTLEDLIEACSEALYEYEGIDKGVSRRTVQADLQMMRSDKLGYNAPIVVVDKKYYAYEDPTYSITNIPLTDQDLGRLTEAVEFMKQFQGFSHFRELDGLVQKLESHLYSQKTHTQPVIDFEKNEHLKGLEYLDVLYRAILQRRALRITYQSFKAQQAHAFDFHPYLLKEFRNRWFVLGMKKKHEGILNLALDRILDLKPSETPFRANPDFRPETYFQHAIGVSVSPTQPPERVVLFVAAKHAPYVLTKPLHSSQELLEERPEGITIQLHVQHNFELEKEILAFGEAVRVLEPTRLRRCIHERLHNALDGYDTELQERSLRAAVQQLAHKGFSMLPPVYTRRELGHIGRLLDRAFADEGAPRFGERMLLKKVPELKACLLTHNLLRIVQALDSNAFLTKALYFDKPPQKNWYVTWHQDVPINVTEKRPAAGFSGWTQRDGVVSVRPPEAISQQIFTVRIHIDDANEANGALKVIPGSHQKRLSDTEIRQLSEQYESPFLCEVAAGGIHLMRPLLLHASSKTSNQKRRRVIHLEFSSQELPKGLEWVERETLE
ncbi:Predicted DNA-binding transcriptional regulator YafY, contains an HTH and WYL domains [Catalinimonas alkaloidigena]|uniref:Predicted DNA-binding transcriptional regulator YafY, contains an HTH and WYL domains n=1 Tax=Catalinimonas alkaloidigena TaxID=1075417 RepID=A0A1G9AFC2_9BACT|nr:WYL domain-containing protein [Catalinimonas alkaloidigena]SDK26072.1 Predicted DNA-binding transcriptional regulator YafY, contains an HTH and WYL domains [Catalinimonas alkaloidigena]